MHSKGPSGRLCIAAAAALISGRLIDDLAVFAFSLPEVRLTTYFSDVPLDLIGDGMDVAIRAGTLQDSSLKSKKLFEIPQRLVASPEYFASKPPLGSPQEVASWDWIKLKSRSPRAKLTSSTGQELLDEFSPRLIVDNAEAMLQFARRGLGPRRRFHGGS